MHREAPAAQLDHDWTSHTPCGVAVTGVELDFDGDGAGDSACNRTDQREREREHEDRRRDCSAGGEWTRSLEPALVEAHEELVLAKRFTGVATGGHDPKPHIENEFALRAFEDLGPQVERRLVE